MSYVMVSDTLGMLKTVSYYYFKAITLIKIVLFFLI